MKRAREQAINLWKNHKPEILIVVFTLVWGFANALYIYSLGLTRIGVDQNSHLNIARLIFDSLTPGVSQLGFWPPLLHILMAPFAAITPLFQTGLAGAFALIPILALGALFAYRLIEELSKRRIPAIGAALLFITNPYILYYSATPMTEQLFITSLLGVAYFLVRWLKTGSFSSLIHLGIFVALSGMTRFEGFFLLPIVAVIIALHLHRSGKSYHEIEATSILFGLVALIGFVLVLVYGIAYGNGPFEFINGVWASQSQQNSLFLPTVGDVGMSIVYMLEASRYMLGSFLLQFALFSFVILLIALRSDNRFLTFLGVSAVLISPFFFDVFALVQGSAVIYLENLAPFDGFFNERYGLYMLGFVVVVPMMLLGFAMQKINHYALYVQNTLGIVVVLLVLGANVLFLNQTAYIDTFSIQRASVVSTLPADQKDIARELREQYDGGKIFITRALQNYVTIEAGIPLKNYILESNYEYYDQALSAPWFYARYVVMYNPEIEGIEDWRRESERISQAWAHSENFRNAYELVYENKSERLYRLNDKIVTRVANLYDLDPDIVPSLNIDITYWEQDQFYETLQNGVRHYWKTRAVAENNIATN